MSVGSFGSVVSPPPTASAQAAASPGDDAAKAFLDYLKEPIAQRMIDAWLKAHHLTEQDLKNMPPAQREAIEKQMAEDIKNQANQKAESKLLQSLGVAG